MRNHTLALSLTFAGLLAGCTAAPTSSTELLIARDQSCSSLKDQSSCESDAPDRCSWLAVPADATVQVNGACRGDASNDLCVIGTQCSRLATAGACGADPNCEWGPALCSQIAGATCPPGACGIKNPCVSLTVDTCSSNPNCDVIEQPCAPDPCPPTPRCPPGRPASQCPPSSCTPGVCANAKTCALKPVVCGTSHSEGDGNGTPGNTSTPPR
jgi:hypothetical protein